MSPFCYDELELALERQDAGQIEVWLLNLDGSLIVPRNARNLPQVVTRTPDSAVAVVRDRLESA